VAVAESSGGRDVRTALLRLRRRGGLPVAFGGLFAGTRQFRISELTGTTTSSLHGLAVTPGNGLGGKVLTMSRPISVIDYPISRAISHEYDEAVVAEGLRSMLAVPVVLRGRVRGVLYGALRQPLALGERALSAAMEAARELERTMAAQDEAKRLTEVVEQPVETDPARWEEVREAFGELRALAQRVTDSHLRQELLTACRRLAAASSGAGSSGPDLSGMGSGPGSSGMGSSGPVGSGAGGRGRQPVELAPREVDVLACVASGATNATAAERLGLRPETVKAYLRSSMRKLGAHTRLQAVVEARRAGVLP
jgi:LuxR family transcriptional regulator, regulator of acetate metabolism